MTAGPSTLTVSLADLQGSPARRRRDARVRRTLLAMAMVSVVVSVLIVLSLFGEAWSFVKEVDPATLWTDGWFPRRDQFDLRTLIVGSTMVASIAMVIAAPVGLGAAIYLSEYASVRWRRVLKPALEVLAGIPSVVLGFFALVVISPDLIRRIFPDAPQSNLLSAGIGVGILTIPLVASVAEDALQAVPQALREGSYGMGARKMTTVLQVVVPAAVSGLVAAFILAISRAVGETMVVLIAAGGGGGALFTVNPLDQGLTMTAAMATQARGTDQVAGSGLAFQSLFFVGLLLFFATLLLNLVADRFVRRVRDRY
ncbi:MAG: phosphate ABC transporter permease subunit PstC [Acidimicrobiales bacterium]